MQWYIEALKKYAIFSGRARRKEYWMFILFNIIIVLALTLFDKLVGTFCDATGHGFFGTLYSFAVIVPNLSVSVRRLHDTGRSGLYFFLAFIPVVNFVLLYFLIQDSTPGENEYGENPKGE